MVGRSIARSLELQGRPEEPRQTPPLAVAQRAQRPLRTTEEEREGGREEQRGARLTTQAVH